MNSSSKVRFPRAVDELVAAFRRLPGVGPRSAMRMAVWLLQQGKQEAVGVLVDGLKGAMKVRICPQCGFFADDEAPPCPACDLDRRDGRVVCVVEQPTEVLPLEDTGSFRGRFHCLGGRLAPLDDVGPEDLLLHPLWDLLATGEVEELILATGSDVEGEATAGFVSQEALVIAPDLKVTRLAQGLPAGGALEGADPLTLMKALANRRGL